MTELNHAKSFRDLLVYQKAKRVSREIFEIRDDTGEYLVDTDD